MSLTQHLIVAGTTCVGSILGGVLAIALAMGDGIPSPLFFILPILGTTLAAFLATPRMGGGRHLWLAPAGSATVVIVLLYFVLDWSSGEGNVILSWVAACFLAPLAATLLFQPSGSKTPSNVA